MEYLIVTVNKRSGGPLSVLSVMFERSFTLRKMMGNQSLFVGRLPLS